MNMGLVTPGSSARVQARQSPGATCPPKRRSREGGIVLRGAEPADAAAIHALIEAHLEEGRLLPRTLAEVTAHVRRFVIAVRQPPRTPGTPGSLDIVGCAELAPLSERVAEVRSLVVERSARSRGVGRRLVEELRRRATIDEFETLCAFTHDAAYFVRKGFTIVPHVWVPEKIALDCHQCALFRRCGQHAVVVRLGPTNAVV